MLILPSLHAGGAPYRADDTSALPRVVPIGGAIIGGHAIAGGTHVDVSIRSLQHNPNYHLNLELFFRAAS